MIVQMKFSKMHTFLLLLAYLEMLRAQVQIEMRITYMTPWQANDKVPIECPKLDSSGRPITKLDKDNLTVLEYGPAPKCLETGEPMYVIYGLDAMSSCAWAVGLSFSRANLLPRRNLLLVFKGSCFWTCIYVYFLLYFV